MDVVHNRSRIMTEEEDRISTLPNEIIHHILSFLDIKFAIQTSTLSKKWKHIWTLMPHLNLNSRTFRTSPKFVKFVNDALSHRNHRAQVSAVELSFRGPSTQFNAVVTSIVNYAYSRNVRKLTLVWFRFNKEVLKFQQRQRLFSCDTLKHLTVATNNLCGSGISIPKSAWDFPALETLNLSSVLFGGDGDKSLNLFSKCVNLRDLTLHGCDMYVLDIFNVCAPQLSNLTITDPFRLPKVYNVVAPKLESLTASVIDIFLNFLQLSIEDLDYLEKVNLSMRGFVEEAKYGPGLLDLFQKLCSAKFLILDDGIIKLLSACLDQLPDEPCPFNNLKCLKIDKKTNHTTTTMPTQVKNYFLESSTTATFIMDLPQVPQKRSREEVDKGTMAKKVSNVIKVQQQTSTEEVDKGTMPEKVPHKRLRHGADNGTMTSMLDKEKQQTKTVDEENRTLEAKVFMQDQLIAEKKAKLEAMKVQNERRMLEAKMQMQDKIIAHQKLEEKMHMQDKVIAEQKVMLETMRLQNEMEMFEAKILSQDKIISEQKAMLEAMKLQHKNIETQLGNIDS